MKNVTAIILAAGLGGRLGNLTGDTPKPLLMVNNRPIISYALAFLKELGMGRIVVVGGFQFEKLSETVRRLMPEAVVVRNSDYTEGNLLSLKAGLDEVSSGGFLLFHADHIFHKGIVQKVKEGCREDIVVFTDNDRKLTDDDMKIVTDETGVFLKHASKKLSNNHRGYVGMTYCPDRCLSLYKKTVDDILARDRSAVTEHAMIEIAEHTDENVHIGDVSGFRWHEVDFPEELERAENVISAYRNDYMVI
ncbi:NTP transferase domain-containing protein [bacterium]|nr:NTP transferase domain-containing protein [bacterium]